MSFVSGPLYRVRRRAYWAVFVGIVAFAFVVLSLPSTWDHGRVPRLFPDRLLYLVQLFVVETPDDLAKPRWWWFQLAYLLATAFTLTAALQLFFALFTRVWSRIVVRLAYRGHRVVCGLSRKGIRLARLFRQAGQQVLLIERDGAHVELETLRGEGFRAIVGDASAIRVLMEAGILRAHSIYLTCSDDTNLRIVRTLEELSNQHAGRHFPVSHVHVADRQLHDELQHTDFARRRKQTSMRVHYHSIMTLAGARLLDWTPESTAPNPKLFSGHPDQSDHFVVIGVGATGFEFVVSAARLWANSIGRRGHTVPPTFHLLDQRAEEWKDELEANNPSLAPYWRLHAHAIGVPSAAFTRGDWRRETLDHTGAANSDTMPEPRRIIVALPSDSQNVVVGLSLLRQLPALQWNTTMIIVRIAEEQGVMWCDALNNNSTPLLRQFQPFNQLKEVLTLDFFRRAPLEQIAMALHEAYRAELAVQNRQREREGLPHFTLVQKPADVDWEVLNEKYHESTRLQAAGVLAELNQLDAPRTVELGPGPEDPLTPAEIETLAAREHDRWMAERRAQGWQHGSPRDDSRKLHPDMIPWDALSESAKSYDRSMVSAWPVALANVGLVIRKKRPQ